MLFECGDCTTAGKSGSSFWRSWVPCWRLDCQTCHERTRARRSTRLYNTFGAVGLHSWVFTLPRQWCSGLGEKAVRAFRRQLAKVLKDWYAEEYGVRVGFLVSTHPAGDREPGVWGPHFDIVVPLLGTDLLTGALRELPAMHSAQALDRVKRAWGAVLDEAAPVLGHHEWSHGRPANVYARFHASDDPEKVRHRITYSARPFPSWSSGTFSRALSVPTRYGLLASGARSDSAMAWREAVSVQSETEKQGCPVCDGGMDYVTTISVDERAVWSACFYVAGLIRPPGEEGSQRPPPPISDEDMAYFCETVIAPMAMD